MATIKNYTAQLGGAAGSGGRRATGADFGGDVAAAVGDVGRVGQGLAEKFLQQEETNDARKMMVGIARLNAKYSTAQQEAIASGADLDKLRENYQNELAGLRNQSSTKHGVNTFDYQEASTLHAYDLRSLQIRAQRAGAQAKTQIEGFATALGQQAFTDPSSLEVLNGKVEEFVTQLPPGVTPEMRAEAAQELKYRLASDAVRGAIQINPEKALAELQSGKWALKPGQLPQEIDRAESQIRAREAQDQNRERHAHWQAVQKSDQLANQYLQQIFSNSFNAEEVNANPSLMKDDRQGLITFNQRWWDSLEGAGNKSNPTVLNSMLLRVYAGEDDPSKVRNVTPLLQAVERREISVRDFRWLNTAIAEQRDPNNSTIGAQFSQMTRTLNDSFMNDVRYARVPGGRIKAGEIVNRWAFAVRGLMDDRRARNQSLYPLFDPASKEYVGNPGFVKAFERNMEGVPTITSKEEARKLPPGTLYQDTAGNLARTPTGKEVPD